MPLFFTVYLFVSFLLSFFFFFFKFDSAILTFHLHYDSVYGLTTFSSIQSSQLPIFPFNTLPFKKSIFPSNLSNVNVEPLAEPSTPNQNSLKLSLLTPPFPLAPTPPPLPPLLPLPFPPPCTLSSASSSIASIPDVFSLLLISFWINLCISSSKVDLIL
ncbi:hypothetical protein LELG_03066 [Lodderomyces elongisporus NRRL YB-4239]|uniref:Uncharacterized protein n=1 Tax=Lodderomyces elongisporus (strain ATCC 11503 / CBS 2605 / JCM 1781 / NBRC 1676 / NRRL YB-4239) TaxID=379508 RepID=A5E0C9_LODEL|nr:hypothetical protein LELG_03066 [Lodderomyces elongisporus NRRL YB-4239]